MDDVRERERQLFSRLCNGKYVTVGSSEEDQLLQDLERQMQQVELDYVNYAQRQLDFRKDMEKQKESLSKTNKLFCLALAGVCLTPLRKGVNSKSVLRVIGLWMGCCFLSKTFRQGCKEAYGYVFSDAMGQMMSNQMRNAKPDSRLAQRKPFFVNGTELPLTPESLAVVQIAFCRQAYQVLREPNANPEWIMERYEQACESLYQQGEAFGIPRYVVDKSMRKIAGDLMDKDATYIGVFEETAYGVVFRGNNVRHTQRYQDNGTVKERFYHTWEGSFVDEQGVEYTQAFHPRKPRSVNELRQLSKEMWDKKMAEAMTPEEWAMVVTRPDARQIQQRYLSYMQEDVCVPEKEMKAWSDLNNYMRDDDDVSWMIDMDGDDPFNVGGFDDSLQDMLEHGVTPDSDTLMIGEYPEFRTAYCKWLNQHPEVSPMEMQRRANACYLTYEAGGKQNKSMLQQVERYLAQRDTLKDRWDDVYVGISEKVQVLSSANETRMKELHRMTRPLPSIGGDVMMSR